MLKAKADDTANYSMSDFETFLDWSKSKQICTELPFPLGVVSLYLFEAVLYFQFFCDFDSYRP